MPKGVYERTGKTTKEPVLKHEPQENNETLNHKKHDLNNVYIDPKTSQIYLFDGSNWVLFVD